MTFLFSLFAAQHTKILHFRAIKNFLICRMNEHKPNDKKKQITKIFSNKYARVFYVKHKKRSKCSVTKVNLIIFHILSFSSVK